MPILITSDIHLSENPRDAYRHKFMVALPKVATQLRADAVFILGDLTENKDNHGAELVNTVVRHLYDLASVCPVVILQGNHDWLSSPQNPYFGFLRFTMRNIFWVGDVAQQAELKFLPDAAVKILGKTLFLPHSANPDRDWQNVNFKQHSWAFTHQTFAGAIGDNGHPLGGASLDRFPRNLKIISGDVHVPQQVGQVTYVGSPYHVDFGDSFEGRMLLIEDDGVVRSLPYVGPQKHLITLQSISELKKQKFLKEDILKVRIEIAPDQYARWPEISNQIRAWGTTLGYTVHSVQPILTQPTNKLVKQKTTQATKTDKDLLVEYAGAKSVDNNTVKTGMNLL